MGALADEVVHHWRLRPMQPAHIQGIMPIEERAYDYPWTVGNFHDCLKAGYSSWVLLKPHDQLAGYALQSLGAGEAHVLNICVDPRYRRQGYGRRLMHHLLDIARAAGIGKMFLEVRRSNRVAAGLYEGMGFELIGMRPAYYPAAGSREDALVYALNLQLAKTGRFLRREHNA